MLTSRASKILCCVFCAKKILCGFFMRKKFCVFFRCTMCNNFFRSSVSAMKTSEKVLSIETKVLYVLVKSKPKALFSDRQSTAERMCFFRRSRKAEMLSKTRLYKNCHNFSSLQFFNSKLGRMLCNSYSNRFGDFYIFPIVGIGAINFQIKKQVIHSCFRVFFLSKRSGKIF